MIDKEKYQKQIIKEIYGFDDENKIGKKIRVELLKDIIGDGLKTFSLNDFKSDNKSIDDGFVSIEKNSDSIVKIKNNYSKKRQNIFLTTDSTNTFIAKIFSNGVINEYYYQELATKDYDRIFFCQELIMFYDTINPYYVINTKFIDSETYSLYGFSDYSDIQNNSEYGFGWNAESTISIPYTSSSKILNDLKLERGKIFDKSVNEKRDEKEKKLVLARY